MLAVCSQGGFADYIDMLAPILYARESAGAGWVPGNQHHLDTTSVNMSATVADSLWPGATAQRLAVMLSLRVVDYLPFTELDPAFALAQIDQLRDGPWRQSIGMYAYWDGPLQFDDDPARPDNFFDATGGIGCSEWALDRVALVRPAPAVCWDAPSISSSSTATQNPGATTATMAPECATEDALFAHAWEAPHENTPLDNIVPCFRVYGSHTGSMPTLDSDLPAVVASAIAHLTAQPVGRRCLLTNVRYLPHFS